MRERVSPPSQKEITVCYNLRFFRDDLVQSDMKMWTQRDSETSPGQIDLIRIQAFCFLFLAKWKIYHNQWLSPLFSYKSQVLGWLFMKTNNCKVNNCCRHNMPSMGCWMGRLWTQWEALCFWVKMFLMVHLLSINVELDPSRWSILNSTCYISHISEDCLLEIGGTKYPLLSSLSCLFLWQYGFYSFFLSSARLWTFSYRKHFSNSNPKNHLINMHN